MRAPVHFVILIIDFIVAIVAVLLGLSSVYGLCVFIWGEPILKEVTLYYNPEGVGIHPSLIVLLLLMVPAMVISLFGALITLILPMHIIFDVPFGRSEYGGLKLLKSYTLKVIAIVELSLEKIEAKNKFKS